MKANIKNTILALAGSLLAGMNLSAQHNTNLNYFAGVDLSSTANGHGAFYCPSLGVNSGANSISFGPIIQRRNGQSDGFRVTYSRCLTQASRFETNPQHNIIDIGVFGYAQYNRPLPLCYSAVRCEQLTSSSEYTDWNSVKLSTLEFTFGTEFRLNISRKITWKSYVGASVYHHVNYVNGMYNDRTAPSLCLGSSFIFYLRNN